MDDGHLTESSRAKDAAKDGSRDATRDATGQDAVERTRLSRFMPWRFFAVGAWLAFSIALATWWLIFGLRQIQRFSELSSQSGAERLADELARQHRMLMYEGTTLIVCLLLGGAALLYYIRTEIRRTQRIREFFAAFTHDLKTSLASLRLQAESLEEDLKESGQSRLARRLVKDTVRLELQLENSLFLAAPASETRFLIEPIRIGALLQTMRHQWPDLEVNVDGEGLVLADSRAVESIFKNLLQNAVIHGRASKMTVDVNRDANWIRVRMTDDGRGFKGDIDKLGRMFQRHSTTSGTGLGLYLATQLAKKMRGDLLVLDMPLGFGVEVLLPAAPVESAETSARSDSNTESGPVGRMP